MGNLEAMTTDGGVLGSYRRAGQASAAAANLESAHLSAPGAKSAAFFDVDNTIMRGSSLFHIALGLARRNYFSASEIAGFARKHVKFVMTGAEDLEDMASATEAGLSFIEGRSVNELVTLGEEIFDEILIGKLIPGTLALAQAHLDAGQQVWLVTATPVELATLIATRLGLTGALGTVSEVKDGMYTGHLDGAPLHGLAKAEAIRALAQREGFDLQACSAYSDSSNDIPMLSAVGNPVAVNPDSTLREHARENTWPIRDFRKREQFKQFIIPAVSGVGGYAAGVGAGLVLGYLIGRSRRR